MAHMKEIIQKLADYTINSGFKVTVDSRFPTVAIEDADGGGFFLQGDEAQTFIDEAREIAEQNDMPNETIYYSSAAAYIDCL